MLRAHDCVSRFYTARVKESPRLPELVIEMAGSARLHTGCLLLKFPNTASSFAALEQETLVFVSTKPRLSIDCRLPRHDVVYLQVEDSALCVPRIDLARVRE